MGKAKLTFLGSGTSQGVPMIGCDCPVCRSADPRDKRLRSSVLVEWEGLTILVDAGPDFRYQMLRANVRHIDAILLTHNHKDHTGGLDDVRAFNLLELKPTNIYCEQYVEDTLRREYSYAFDAVKYPGSPEIHTHIISGAKPFTVISNEREERLVWVSGKGYEHYPGKAVADCAKAEVVPIQGWHLRDRSLSVLGYRFGDIAYVTDLSCIDECEYDKLAGLDCVTVNCVKRGVHRSHFSLDEAMQFFQKVGAKHSYLTHISHLLPCHTDLERELAQVPVSVRLADDTRLPEVTGTVGVAYDGLIINQI